MSSRSTLISRGRLDAQTGLGLDKRSNEAACEASPHDERKENIHA
jgi:hypothetical protein